MVYCKDCKYQRSSNCEHEKAVQGVDVVWGGYDYEICRIMRKPERPCGPEGVLFERASLLDKIVNIIR